MFLQVNLHDHNSCSVQNNLFNVSTSWPTRPQLAALFLQVNLHDHRSLDATLQQKKFTSSREGEALLTSSMGRVRWVRPVVEAVATVTAIRQGRRGGDWRGRLVWRETGASGRCREPTAGGIHAAPVSGGGWHPRGAGGRRRPSDSGVRVVGGRWHPRGGGRRRVGARGGRWIEIEEKWLGVGAGGRTCR
jgi:hypothetical protein